MPSFTGLDLALIGGYDSVGLGDDAVCVKQSGIMYGLSAGYNVHMGPVIAGLEAEVAFSTIRKSARHVFFTVDNLNVSTSRDIYVGPRIGTRLGSNLLIFDKVGYMNARLKATYNDGFMLLEDAKICTASVLAQGMNTTFNASACVQNIATRTMAYTATTIIMQA